MALVRVYCGLASANPPRQLAVGSSSLSATIVDDAGRILDVCDIGDDSYGFAYLNTLLAERATGPYSVAIACDSDQHLATRLLITAGWAVAVVETETTDDFAERFAEPLTDTIEAVPTQRRALGLARALQAGAVSAGLLPPTPDLAPLRPILAAMNALANARQSAAVALREVLRELYPAALRAYPDPADPIALAVIEALPEPATLTSSTSRGRDALEAVTAQLTSAGVGDQASITEAITALRVAVAETPRRNGLSRALTSTVAEAVRQAVAAVRAYDTASSVLVAALAERTGDADQSSSAPAAPAALPTRVPRTAGSAAAQPLAPGAAAQPLAPSVTAQPLAPAAAHSPAAAPMSQPASVPPAPAAPAPAAYAEPSPHPRPQSPGPLATQSPEPVPPRSPMPQPATAPRPAASSPANGSRPATPARQTVPRQPASPPARAAQHALAPATAPPAPAGGSAGSDPSTSPLSNGFGHSSSQPAEPTYLANRPVSTPPPPPPGITPIKEPARSARRSRSDSGHAPDQQVQVPLQRRPLSQPPPGSRSTWPTDQPADDAPADSWTSRNGGGVTPPWRAEDLRPPEPPMLRLVEPTLPEELRDDLGLGFGDRSEAPALRLVQPAAGNAPRSAPPVSADDDDNLLIFAQTRSAWFDHEADTSAWQSAMDFGWRAAEQAAEPTVGDRTGAGLPRRVPHANLVPGAPPRADDRQLRVVRDPARIAAHTSGYFSGWRRGQEVGGFPVGSRQHRSGGAWEFHRDDDRMSG